MNNFYQKPLGILAGAAAATGLVTLLSIDAPNVSARTLDGQIFVIGTNNPSIVKARTPLDEYLDLFKGFVNKYRVEEYREYHQKSGSNRLFMVSRGIESDQDNGCPIEQNQTILVLGKYEYRMRGAGLNYEFSFSDNSDVKDPKWDTFRWVLSPSYETVGFNRGQRWAGLLCDSHPVQLGKMSQEDRADFGQLDKRFLEFLSGIRRFK